MNIQGLASARAFLMLAASAGAQPSYAETITNLNTAHRDEANAYHVDRLRP